MKDFILNIWYDAQYILMYSVRGMLWAVVVALMTVLVSAFMPKEIIIFSNSISLMPYHLALYAIGTIYALQILVTFWVKDYKRNYIPRWLRD